jgi:D-lactate dehydrogenase
MSFVFLLDCQIFMQKSLPNEFLSALKTIFSTNDILIESEECWTYGYDNSRRHALPQVVVFATTHEQVLRVVKLCNEFDVAITGRGRGTGTTGAIVPLHGGLVL